MNNKAVIFLAFSQDYQESNYLRNLSKEQETLHNLLRPLEKEGMIEIVVRSDASAKEIFKVCMEEDYRNRIAIFHYAGHASGKGLHVIGPDGTNELAHAQGLTQLFSMQQNLQLVFLNGCSTQAQIAGLIEAKVKNVIATVNPIPDDLAVVFAEQFYSGLANQNTINESYQAAKGFITTQHGVEKTRELFIKGKLTLPTPDKFSWLHVKAEEESSLTFEEIDYGTWRIADARGWKYGEQPNLKVFLVHAKADETHKHKLLRHIKILERQKQIDAFNTGMINAGKEMALVVKQHFNNSKIILLLITDNFIHSDFAYQLMELAMQKHHAKESVVIPILISETLIDNADFTRLQPLPRNGKFVNQWNDVNSAYTDIAKGLRGVVESFKKG